MMFNIDFSEFIWRLKLVSIILSVLFGFVFAYSMVKFLRLVKIKIAMNKALRPPESARGGALQSKWEEIMHHAESNREAAWKLAIIEADNLVDDILKSASYLGDTMVGNSVNIGAGTITCNYDGQSKHKTVIEDGAFIGSDTQFVAPVTVGAGAYVGAGSTITRDVPPRSLGVSRATQRNIEGWVAGRSAREGKKSGHPPSERGKRRR